MKIEIAMKVIEKKVKRMAKGNIFLLMVLFTMVNGTMMINVVKALWIMLMEIFIMVNG